jgi:hypothetical protein
MSTKAEAAQAFIAQRRTAYVRTFDTPAGEEVLADLAKFCRANESTFHPDARVHAVMEGRREVYLRLQNHLQLSDQELARLLGAPPLQHTQE